MINFNRRNLLRWAAGLFPALGLAKPKILGYGELHHYDASQLPSVKANMHDGCFRAVRALRFTGDVNDGGAKQIIMCLSADNEILRQSGPTQFFEVRDSSGCIEASIEFVFHRRIPVQTFLDSIDLSSKGALLAQLKAQTIGSGISYDPNSGSMPRAYGSSTIDADLKCAWPIQWPHEPDVIERILPYIKPGQLKTIAGRSYFQRRASSGRVLPGYESFIVSSIPVSEIVSAMTLADRHAMLALFENAQPIN